MWIPEWIHNTCEKNPIPGFFCFYDERWDYGTVLVSCIASAQFLYIYKQEWWPVNNSNTFDNRMKEKASLPNLLGREAFVYSVRIAIGHC
jgi:hypothetical protein